MNSDLVKYNNKYRIASARMKDWDYTADAWYFVTICTKTWYPFFGEIQNGDVRRSLLGEIAHRYWLEIPEHFQRISLDEFVIMPNHVHGIIVIDPLDISDGLVETQHAASLQSEYNPLPKLEFRNSLPKPRSVSTIVRSFKSAVTRWAGRNNFEEFSWQARFYDRIIRDVEALSIVRAYIIDNPRKWEADDYCLASL